VTLQNEVLQQGVSRWNKWRKSDRMIPDLSGLDLRGKDLHRINLSEMDLRDIKLNSANLRRSDLSRINLTNTDLSSANLKIKIELVVRVKSLRVRR
jgi:uncharacterized protein YjbI with pentapeptide repeats